MGMEQHRSVCPVACALDIVGDKWTLLVVRDLMCGCAHFKEFLKSPEGIATNILTDRLNRLVEHGLAEKYASTEHPGAKLTGSPPRGSRYGPCWLPSCAGGSQTLKGRRH